MVLGVLAIEEQVLSELNREQVVFDVKEKGTKIRSFLMLPMFKLFNRSNIRHQRVCGDKANTHTKATSCIQCIPRKLTYFFGHQSIWLTWRDT